VTDALIGSDRVGGAIRAEVIGPINRSPKKEIIDRGERKQYKKYHEINFILFQNKRLMRCHQSSSALERNLMPLAILQDDSRADITRQRACTSQSVGFFKFLFGWCLGSFDYRDLISSPDGAA
jgi:hypothetical protein